MKFVISETFEFNNTTFIDYSYQLCQITMTWKFIACLLVATLFSTVMAVPYRKAEFAAFLSKFKKKILKVSYDIPPFGRKEETALKRSSGPRLKMH